MHFIFATNVRNNYDYNALGVMKTHGMHQSAIQAVFVATTLAKLLYCSPAWWGFTIACDRDAIEGFLRRCQRFGYCSASCPCFAELCNKADNKLFKQILTNTDHVLRYLLPPRYETFYDLRPRRHDRAMQMLVSRHHDANYTLRMLKNNRCEQ